MDSMPPCLYRHIYRQLGLDHCCLRCIVGHGNFEFQLACIAPDTLSTVVYQKHDKQLDAVGSHVRKQPSTDCILISSVA